ncbi:DUF4362 domain-containing protein [Brevibacillus fluminis]|uniref:DUF4362 domain-containing protein n=1 Tax=Brevibacillus fluminis TaxID=511487 RepID=A0A3M8DF45_9BACL|nr:DUF4362 domain-containing protein [Brevibacillus fluminis]RNB85945.1 DUF4362 domain-containing protein [Brevibacillus fluminis]
MKRRFLAGFIIGLGLILILTYAMSQRWLTSLAVLFPFADVKAPAMQQATPGILDIGKTTYIHTRVENGELKQQFFTEAKKGTSVRWTFDKYTTEGDPIHHILIYQPNSHTYQVTIDTTDDKFGSPSVTTMTCARFDEIADSLTGCDHSAFFHLGGVPLLPMTKENGLAYLRGFASLQWKDEFISAEAVDGLPLPADIQPATDYYTYQLQLQDQTYTIAIHKQTWQQHWFDTLL